jgi:3-(methylthio)propanoyl-CoA dehydrogenase
VHCVSIEHKLGIKASPTAVLQYGDHGGAVGYLVGQENRGLEYMFIMMNAARFAVGVQGIAVAERAYQKAVAYARDRVQSRPVDGSLPAAAPDHPPPRRAPHADDDARLHRRLPRDGHVAARRLRRRAPRTPTPTCASRTRPSTSSWCRWSRAFSTEMSLEVASLGVQVHGGMGFIEETGAAQYLRDAKILTIYEGTTAIQANDLVGRKTARDGGAVARAIAGADRGHRGELAAAAAWPPRDGQAPDGGAPGLPRRGRLRRRPTKASPNEVFAGSVPYLMLAGTVVAGWQMARALLVAEDRLAAGEDAAFMRAKIVTARFYADHILSQGAGPARQHRRGRRRRLELPLEAF